MRGTRTVMSVFVLPTTTTLANARSIPTPAAAVAGWTGRAMAEPGKSFVFKSLTRVIACIYSPSSVAVASSPRDRFPATAIALGGLDACCSLARVGSRPHRALHLQRGRPPHCVTAIPHIREVLESARTRRGGSRAQIVDRRANGQPSDAGPCRHPPSSPSLEHHFDRCLRPRSRSAIGRSRARVRSPPRPGPLCPCAGHRVDRDVRGGQCGRSSLQQLPRGAPSRPADVDRRRDRPGGARHPERALPLAVRPLRQAAGRGARVHEGRRGAERRHRARQAGGCRGGAARGQRRIGSCRSPARSRLLSGPGTRRVAPGSDQPATRGARREMGSGAAVRHSVGRGVPRAAAPGADQPRSTCSRSGRSRSSGATASPR